MVQETGECFIVSRERVEYKSLFSEQITAYGYESASLCLWRYKTIQNKATCFCSVASFWYNRLYYLDVKMYDFPKGYAAYIVKEASWTMDGVVWSF